MKSARLMAFLLLGLPVWTACAASPGEIRAWGSMREVLGEGRDEARIALSAVARPGRWGVGALAGLQGEIWIADGAAWIAEPDANREGIRVRPAREDDSAALLVLASVPAWTEHPLPACADLDALEMAIAERLAELGRPVAQPTAVRVRGVARGAAFHVIAGACPIAHPEGPPPLRGEVRSEMVELVGVFAPDSAGVLTHHGRRSHLHLKTAAAMGHLDEIALGPAQLLLPAAR